MKSFLRKNTFFRNTIFSKDETAQVFLIGGVIITIAILGFGVIITNIGGFAQVVDKESFLFDEYNNVRKEFGLVLKQNYEKDFNVDYLNLDIINFYFNDSRDIFIFVEAAYGNFFNAEIIRVLYKGDNINGLVVRLSLSNDYDYISEEVNYYFY